jgi:hypothetical protein
VSARAAPWVAWSLWVLSVGFAVLAVFLALHTPPFPEGAPDWGVVLAVSFLAYPTVGAFVASRQPKNPVGWILCGVGLLFATQGFAIAYAGYTLSARSDSLPGDKIALWVAGWFDYPMLFLAAALLVLLFPDGRLPDRRWRAVPWIAVGGSVLWTLRLATAPTGPFDFFYRHMRNPFRVDGALGEAVEGLGRLGQAALFMICVASVIAVFVRLEGAQGEERQQIKWFAYAAAVLLSAVGLVAPATGGALAAIGVPWGVAFAIPIVLGLLAIPLAVGVAILRYRLYDIDVLINRTLVYGSLTGMLAAGLLWRRGSDPGDIPCPHRPRGATPTRHSRLHSCDSRSVQPLEAPYPVLHRWPLLPQQVRCEKDPRSFLCQVEGRDGPGCLKRRPGGSGKGDDAAFSRLFVAATRYTPERQA